MRAVRESTILVAFVVGLVMAVSGSGQNPPPIPPISDIHQGFIYQIVTDRFFNGDVSNDNPSQSAGEFDPKGFRRRRTGVTTGAAIWPGLLRSWRI